MIEEGTLDSFGLLAVLVDVVRGGLDGDGGDPAGNLLTGLFSGSCSTKSRSGNLSAVLT